MKDWTEYDYSIEFSLSVGDMVHRPMIGVKIDNGKEEYGSLLMIDSGTERTLLNADLAKLLDIDPSKCKTTKVGGVGGQNADAFISSVNIKVDGFDEPITIEAGFVSDLSVGGLLGQCDFFKYFKVLFDKSKNKFYLKKEGR